MISVNGLVWPPTTPQEWLKTELSGERFCMPPTLHTEDDTRRRRPCWGTEHAKCQLLRDITVPSTLHGYLQQRSQRETWAHAPHHIWKFFQSIIGLWKVHDLWPSVALFSRIFSMCLQLLGGFAPDPIGALTLDPAGGLPSPDPCFVTL